MSKNWILLTGLLLLILGGMSQAHPLDSPDIVYVDGQPSEYGACESGLVSGSFAYDPQPLDNPADGNLLVCCSRPVGDIVIDL